MSSTNPKNQKEIPSSVPIYFSNQSSSKFNYLIGKVKFNSEKSEYKLKSQENPNTKAKEYVLLNRENNNFQLKGREGKQDSNYILMKYNSKNNEIMMYPANIWVNFFNAPIASNKKSLSELDKKRKKLNINDQNEEDKNEQKKKANSIMANNELEEIEFLKKPKKKKTQKFKEDSHSSEDEMELGYDSYGSEIEEENKKKPKKKEEKNENNEGEEEEEEEESEDKDSNENDDDDSKFLNQFNDYTNLIGKKRERENNPSYEMEEKLEIILRKKSKMTEDEIINEIKKVCKFEDIEKYFDSVLEKMTSNFIDDKDKKTYYFLKK